MSEPSTNGANGRRADGRFPVGNPGGPGNPRARQSALLRSAMLVATTPDDIRAVADALLHKAKAGDVAAIRELFDRLFGKAAPMDLGDDGDDGPRTLRLSFDE